MVKLQSKEKSLIAIWDLNATFHVQIIQYFLSQCLLFLSLDDQVYLTFSSLIKLTNSFSVVLTGIYLSDLGSDHVHEAITLAFARGRASSSTI